jgi:integrase/recombinase XerD
MGKLQDKMQMVMEVNGFRPQTQKAYLACVRRFVAYYGRSPETLGTEEIRTFLYYLIKEQQLSSGTINQYYSALKFFYEVTLGRPWAAIQLPRMKRPKPLPGILSVAEVRLLLEAPLNLKHRSLLATVYSGGLRSAEVQHLRVADIDSERMLIRVRQGKGQKERYTLLSHYALALLRQYWQRDRPRDWLFPGQVAGRPLSPSCGLKIMQRALRLASITKPATVHTLRHCFATHLLEMGVELYYIKKMLGHSHVSTTARYLHVTRRSLADLVSPMDQWAPLEPSLV